MKFRQWIKHYIVAQKLKYKMLFYLYRQCHHSAQAGTFDPPRLPRPWWCQSSISPWHLVLTQTCAQQD